MTKFNKALVIAAIFASFQAKAWTTTQEAADRLGASGVKEISFDKTSTSLTEAQKTEIRNAVNEAAQSGKIDEVKVLAWADKEYPASGKLSKEDKDLAKRRAEDLKRFLKDELKVSSVATYNMTERPNGLQKLFNTSDAKVKNVAESTGGAPTEGNTGLFDSKAQASKAAIMIFMKR